MDYGIFKMCGALARLFVAVIFTSAALLSAMGYEHYLQAHNAYADGNYQKAVDLFSGLSHESVPVLYNLGCAHYKNGNLYEALKSFYCAARSAQGAERVRAFDLYEQMQQALGIYKAENSYFKKIRQLSWYIPTVLLQLLLLLLMLLVILSTYKRKRIFFYCVLLCAVGIFLLVYGRYTEKTAPIAFAKQHETTVYTGPDNTYGTVSQVPQGTLFSIVSQHDLWYCVAFDYHRGWVSTKDVDVV